MRVRRLRGAVLLLLWRWLVLWVMLLMLWVVGWWGLVEWVLWMGQWVVVGVVGAHCGHGWREVWMQPTVAFGSSGDAAAAAARV